jgi:DNA-binding transcriptional MerR regulator
VLSGLASIDKSGMSADEIRQLLNIPTQQQPRSRQAAAPAAASSRPASLAEQQAQQRRQQQQQQQQQRVVGPAELQKTARQLGQLSPELAQEWHDRALRQSLDQVGGM